MFSLQRSIDGRINHVQISKCIKLHHVSVINPLIANPWKKKSLKITKSGFVKEEVIRSFGKQSTYKKQFH